VSGGAGPARAALALAAAIAALVLAPPSVTLSRVAPPADLAGPARILFGLGIDPNRAGLDTLEALPGIGPGRAAAWVEERSRAPFCRPVDLERVTGIGPKTRAGLEPFLIFESPEIVARCPDDR
jgi:competence protein ComEA